MKCYRSRNRLRVFFKSVMICKEFNASSHRRLDSQDPKYNMNRDEAEREAEISDLVEMDEDERENEKGYSEGTIFAQKT